jgi:hypothetical protein
VTFGHSVAVAGVAVLGALIAFWVLSSIAGIVFFFVKLAVVVALVGGVVWLVNRLRR